jgi:glycosyltransferase involved in cell wall biosynthesis
MANVTYNPYSVLMSVYFKEKPNNLREALDSMFCQTLPPQEIVLVEDGPLTDELYAVLDEYSAKYSILKRIVNEKNMGLGLSLQKGLAECSNELVARMDTDDISKPDRCEKQVKYFLEHNDVDVVGTNIDEFTESIDKVVSKRIVPSSHDEICKYIKKRNPFNHMSVMYKKSAVLNAGSYQDLYLYEDYYLWVRMFLKGCKFANLNECLVFARIAEMGARRGGRKYFKSDKKLFKYMLKNKMISVSV